MLEKNLEISTSDKYSQVIHLNSPKHNRSGKAVLAMDMSMLVNEGQQLENQLSELSESLVHEHVKSRMQNRPQALTQENFQSTLWGAGIMSTFKISHFLNSQKHHEDTSPYNYSNLTQPSGSKQGGLT